MLQKKGNNMLENLKRDVLKANLDLVKYNLVIFTWGNVSARSDDGYIVIKPSGVSYESMKAEDMVVLDLNGDIVEGNLRPSSDTPTHLELYKRFADINGVCHTHSPHATSFAQAGKGIECFGTTHADYFYGTIPCTRELTQEETENEYEKNTGKVIIECIADKNAPLNIPAILVQNHGVFSWGDSAGNAVHNAVVTEELAKMNFETLLLNPNKKSISQYTLDKHYNRKHGKNAYYGQK